MNTEAARQFCHGAFLAQRCQRHLRLELCRMLLPDLRHPVTPSPAAILGAGVSLSHLSSFRGPAHFSRSLSSNSGNTSLLISFSRNADSYRCSPKPRSHTPMSIGSL